jgi:5'(3')-deoxyribonucleotidase
MKRLIVDMDGVLADACTQFLTYDERATGRRKPMAEITGIPELEMIPHANDYVNAPGFFRTAPLIPGSREALEQLNRHYEVFIVSAAIEYPRSLHEKVEWLGEHFPFIPWQRIVLCGFKHIIRGDIMIDDHFKNLDFFEGRTLLFTQPHNQGHDNRGHQRVNGWPEVTALLL